MVVNDSPAGFCLLEDQGESAVRFIFAALKQPATKYYSTIVAEQSDLEIGELELAHLLERVVTLLITLKHRLPAARDVIAGNKHSVIGFVVTLHVAFYVAFIPGVTLRIDDCLDGIDGFLISLSVRKCVRVKYQES